MAYQDISSEEKILKERYLGPVLKTWYAGTPELAMFDKMPPEVNTGGKSYLQSLHTRPNESAGPRAEGATLPPADINVFEQLSIPRTHYYSRGSISGPAISAARATSGRLLDILMTTTQTTLDSIRNRLCQHVYGDGSAALATVVAGTLSTTQASVNSVKGLRVGMPINIGTNAGADAEDTAITAITPATSTAAAILTFTAIAAAPEAGDLVYPVGASATGGAGTALSYNKAIDGLPKIVDNNNTYAGVTRTTSTDWANCIVRSAAAGLSPDFIWDILNELRVRGGGITQSMPAANKLGRYVMLCSNKTFRAVGNMFYQSRTWNDNIRKISGIISAFDMDGVDVVWTNNCGDTDCYILDRESIHWLVEEDINMSDMTGSIWIQDTDLDVFKCRATWRGNLWTSKPNGHARITNVPVTSYYDS